MATESSRLFVALSLLLGVGVGFGVRVRVCGLSRSTIVATELSQLFVATRD